MAFEEIMIFIYFFGPKSVWLSKKLS